MSVVIILKCEEYDFEKLYKTLKKGIELCGGLEFVKNKKVLLKPNLLAPNKPEDAVTTHPIFVKAVIRLIKENGGKVIIGDSPGLGTQDNIYKITGIKKVAEEENVEIANFRDKVEIESPDGKYVNKFTLAKAVSEVDYIFSLPKLKTHGMTYYTGAIKNLFGTVPGLLKPQFHYKFPNLDKFSDMLVDLLSALKPSFAFMDAIISMEGNGPRNGNPVKTGLILISKDLTALDATACRIIGINPFEIAHIAKAAQRKLGKIELKDIEIKGEKLENVKIPTFKKSHKRVSITFIPIPKKFKKLIENFIAPKPYLIHKKCIMCKECYKVCPAKAISIIDNKIVIDLNKCIKCFCCQEMCPKGAIIPKRQLFNF